jgi:hypothetical protein
MPSLLKQTFKAWLDEMPGSKPKLIVTGELEIPTTGWKGELKLHQPQGINKKILLLDAVTVPPSGPAGQMMGKLPLRYEQPAAPGEYTQVTILYEHDSVTVDVKPVH